MDTAEVIETKKQKINDEIVTDLPKEFSFVEQVDDEPQAEIAVDKVNDIHRREDSNGNVRETSAETSGDKTSDGPIVEQNSSGFGDEIGIDEKEDSETDDVHSTRTNIFQTDDLAFSDRLEAYSEIFQRCEFSNIHKKMYEYLNENVQFDGWRAIWKVDKKGLDDCDVLVEVDAAPTAPTPHIKVQVHLVEPFHCISGGEACVGEEMEEKQQKITELLKEEDDSVDLIDLYPIFDKTGLLDDTALAIEHARFFYQHLWRPMDDEDDAEGSTFMDKYLKQRLKFFYDIQEKNIPAHIVRKHKKILAEYLTKYNRIRGLQGQLEDSGESDVELDMNESRMAVDIMDLHEEIEVLKLTLEKLENPFLRSLMNIPHGVLSQKSPGARYIRPDDSVRTFLIAEKLTAGMIQDLDLPLDVIIEHRRVPGDALAQCYNGDRILIFPGKYPGEGFYTLNQSVTIRGVGKREEIVIVCEELADIFLDCDAPSAAISNLTLEDENGETWDGLVAVRPGCRLVMEDCVLKDGAMGVTVFRGGTLEMKRCEIHHVLKNGVRCKSGSTVHIGQSHIHHCGLAQEGDKEKDTDDDDGGQLIGGISVEIQGRDEDGDKTTLEITNSKVCDNQGAAVVVLVTSKQKEMPEPITTDVISLIRGVKVIDISDNEFSNNTSGDAMLAHIVDE